MTAPRFELTSQRQKVSRLQTEPPGRPASYVRLFFPKPTVCWSVVVCVVCVFSSHSFWTSSSLDVPTGVTQEEGHTGFLIHLLSAVRALFFLARRVQPFLSLVDREVLLTIQSFSTRWAFLFIYLFIFSEKNSVCRDRTHVPTCQKVTWLPLSYRGDRWTCVIQQILYCIGYALQRSVSGKIISKLCQTSRARLFLD